MDPFHRKRIAAICAYADALAGLATTLAILTRRYEHRNPSRKRKICDLAYHELIINYNDVDCRNQIRMSRKAFFRLRNILKEKSSIKSTINTSLEEQLVMFIHTLSHNLKNCNVGHNFGHSGETVSRHFHRVLKAIISLHNEYFKPPGLNTPSKINGNDRFHPYFKDSVGAIDRTHIPVTVSLDVQAKYRNRKQSLSQNVMGICSFNLKFQYVLVGWEGFAANSRVLGSALSRADPFIVLTGKYYLVDAGYPNVAGFLALYQNTCYHLKEFSSGSAINSPEELFNHRHSSLRNAIERTFGVLKACFPILKVATSYPIKTQVKIVIACYILHNFITSEDSVLSDEEIEEEEEEEGKDEGVTVPMLGVYGRSPSEREDWVKFRNEIAKGMWEDYRSCSRS